MTANRDQRQSENGAEATPIQQPRPARSKTGCMTCRRRKVRCDEQRPRCSHCERLNLECKWRSTTVSVSQQRRLLLAGQSDEAAATPHKQLQQALPSHLQPSPGESNGSGDDLMSQRYGVLHDPGAVDRFFDFASFMWDPSDPFGQGSPESQQLGNIGTADAWPGTRTTDSVSQAAPWLMANPQPPSKAMVPFGSAPDGIPSGTWEQNGRPEVAPAEDRHLIDYFVQTVVPPILAEVETLKRWSSMRQMLVSMSNSAATVRCAILAFSNLLLCRKEAPPVPCPPYHYETASAALTLTLVDCPALNSHSPLREHLLATLFFLIYIDILEDRVTSAHANLKRAYDIFWQGGKRGFRPVELTLLSWIRLLDARAVSAGGEGLFLSDSNASLLAVQPSPASVEGNAVDNANIADRAGTGSDNEPVKESDTEDVLFQVLYHPGVAFFQKVQSYMGRISKIDPWHRSRGTVEDETEVMHIASRILQDLRDLYNDRPMLLDHAVAGYLTTSYISSSLAHSITRAFRTYLCNYHASKVHLHRVAYKHLPLTRETTEALDQIRQLTRLMVDGLEPDAALPVNQLWPLLMLGSEEKDLAERAWIKEQILRLGKVATNARLTAQVLEEVQARQDASGVRVDIRSVMHAIFDSCFAIM